MPKLGKSKDNKQTTQCKTSKNKKKMKKTEPKVNRKNITMKTGAEKNERPEQH